jgi:toxin-antitoxin system PIN domain toxin
LLDLNVLAALTSDEHQHHRKAQNWFDSLGGAEWAICPWTEAGYIRLSMNPAMHFGPGSFSKAVEVLLELAAHPDYRYWPITESWVSLTAPFAARILGHQQITDAYLLGLAIKNDGALVTFDRAIRYLAGEEFAAHLLVLE